jgi:hypothetical protein
MHGVRWSPLASSRSDAVVQLHHLDEWNFEAALQLEQDAERRVDLAALDRTDVVAVEIGTVAELLLREALCWPRSPRTVRPSARCSADCLRARGAPDRRMAITSASVVLHSIRCACIGDHSFGAMPPDVRASRGHPLCTVGGHVPACSKTRLLRPGHRTQDHRVDSGHRVGWARSRRVCPMKITLRGSGAAPLFAQLSGPVADFLMPQYAVSCAMHQG